MPPSQANPAGGDFPALEPPSDNGLLEQSALLIDPPDDRGRRALRDAAGRLVGLCHQQPAGWLARRLGAWPALLIDEAEEQPLVFTAQPALLPRYLVRDADGEAVGVVRRRDLHDRWGRLLALYRRRQDRAGGLLELPNGPLVASWHADEGPPRQLRLELKGGPGLDPFVRMLVLARVLAGWRD